MTAYAGTVPMRHVARTDAQTGMLVSEITSANLERLGEYSTSMPTLPSVGRVWKCQTVSGIWLLWHCYAHTESHCLIACRRLVVVDAATCETQRTDS